MAYRTVLVKTLSEWMRNEAKADAGITPGHLLERTSTGVKVHATASGNVVPKLVAIENDLQGDEIGTAYTTGARVQFIAARPGDQLYMLLKDGETASVGSLLKSGGTGALQVYTAASGEPDYVEAIVGVALEAVDMSGSSGADPSGRILVEIS